jgi:hypothetical protein
MSRLRRIGTPALTIVANLLAKPCSQQKETVVNESELSDDEFLIYEALQHQSSLKVQNIMDILNKKSVLPVIQKLIHKNIINYNNICSFFFK